MNVNRYRQLEQATSYRELIERERKAYRDNPSGEFANELLERGRDYVKRAKRIERNIAKLQHGKPLGYFGAYNAALNKTFNRRAMPDRKKANTSELTARRILRDRAFRNAVRREFKQKHWPFRALHRMLRFA